MDKRPNRLESSKPVRIPVSKATKTFNLPDVPAGYKARLVLEIPGRVEMFEAAGWKVYSVSGTDHHYNGKAHEASPTGSVVREVVNYSNLATAKTAVMMIIPQELYDADMAEKLREVDEMESTFKKQQSGMPGAYGEVGSDQLS